MGAGQFKKLRLKCDKQYIPRTVTIAVMFHGHANKAQVLLLSLLHGRERVSSLVIYLPSFCFVQRWLEKRLTWQQAETREAP